MSPEICAAERYSLYSDIWSVGCLIYELCTKEPPFNARTHIELFHKIKSGRVSPIPPVYSSELQKVITSCLQVNPNSRPDTAQLLNLPVVKLMRKEQEVVRLGRQLKKDRDAAEQRLKEAEKKAAHLESDREVMKAEISSQLRREWEVKARLEIDRQVELETERLRRLFEAEVSKRVAIEVEQHLNGSRPERARSSTPSLEEDESTAQIPVGAASQSTVGSDSEFPSQTDISSLSSEDSPFASKQQKPLKKSTRTPFTRAKTVANYAPSPMDVTMADPSPMSIASLALSPRKDGTGQKGAKPKPNLFTSAEDRWKPTNASAVNSPAASDFEDDINNISDDEDDDVPVLPSPTRDPFKQMQKRPSLTRQKTMPANTKRLVSAPNLFAKTNGNAIPTAKVKRPASAVPVIATSPTRKAPASPTMRAKTTSAVPKFPIVSDNGSPVKRPASKESGLPSKQGMLRTAMRNQLHGRTLVELAQARAGGVDREKLSKENGTSIKTAVKVVEAEVPVWDPEKDEMPSPFLVRGTKNVRPMFR
jgi:NIMA (never in mitosis gene a)-related kinase 2